VTDFFSLLLEHSDRENAKFVALGLQEAFNWCSYIPGLKYWVNIDSHLNNLVLQPNTPARALCVNPTPFPLWLDIFTNEGACYSEERAKVVNSALGSAFIWIRTIEGPQFWSDVALNLNNLKWLDLDKADEQTEESQSKIWWDSKLPKRLDNI
jgi:hypothetical protein